MNQSFYYDNAESLDKIRQDLTFLDTVKDPLKNPYTLASTVENPDEDVLTKGEREAYLIGNYAKRGYVPTFEGYQAYELWKKQNEPNAWNTVWEATKHATSTVMGGIYDTVTSGDVLNPLTVGGTVAEGGARGTRYFLNMVDQVKYDPTNPIHRLMFQQGTPEQRYADFQKGLEFQRETGEIEEAGLFVPKKDWDVLGWKVKSFNEQGVAATEMVLDPSIIMPELKIGALLGETMVGKALAESAAKVAVRGSKLAEKLATGIEGGAGKIAATSMGLFEYPAKKFADFTGIETLTTSNGKVIAKDSIVRSSTMGLAGTAYFAQIPYVSSVAGLWLGAKVTEIGGKTIAEALSHSRTPSYLTIADRLAYQSTDPAVRAIGGIAMRTSGFTDWATQGVKSTFHGSMYGGAFGFALGGEEGFYNGVGTGIGLAGSFHMLGGAYGIIGNRKERQIENAQKHFAYVAEGFDEAKRIGVNRLLQNIEDVYGQEKMFRTMANIAAIERFNKNGRNLILTTEQIRTLLGNSPDWAEYEKLMKDPQFGGYTTRRSDTGEIVTLINADYAAHSAVSGELFHSALLQRYGQGMKEHLVKGLLGTAETDGFLYKLSPESRVKMLEDFKRAYLELDDIAGGGSQRKMLEGFNDAIERVRRGEKPETLYPIFEEFAESYFNRWLEDKPIDYLLRGSSPWESVLDGAKKMVRSLIDGDVERIGGRIKFNAGEPEGFFLDGNGKRVVVPEMDRIMRLLVREMKKDPEALEGFPIRDDSNPNHIMLKDAEHLFTKDENGKTVLKSVEQEEREWSKAITGIMSAHAKLKPEERGLRFTERKPVVEKEDTEGSFAPKSKKATELEKEAKRLEKITKQRQAKLLREAARQAKLSEKEQRKLANETEVTLESEVDLMRGESEKLGIVEYKIEGYMTDAEIKLFNEYLPKAVVNRMAALNRTIHTKGSDGNNVLRFDYYGSTEQKFSYTKEGRPTGADNRKIAGRPKTRDIVPYEMILKFERKRLTKKLRQQYGIEDEDAAYAAIAPVLIVNGIDMKTLDRRVRYAYNHMRKNSNTSSISSATVKMYYDSEEEIHHDIKRLLGNYSLGDVAMAGADFFGGGSEGRAKRDIINAIIGARPVRVDAETMQEKGYHYPLDLQRPMVSEKSGRISGPLNEAFMPFTSFRVDRMLDRPKHLHGEGFYYDHDKAHPLNKGNFQPRAKAIRDHTGRALSYSERQLQDETTFKSPSGEPFRVFTSNSEGGVHYAWFNESKARETHSEIAEGYIALRDHEVLDLLNNEKIDSIKELDKTLLGRISQLGYKAVVARTTDGDRVIAFTDFNNFRQTDVSAFDAVMGNFAPRSKTLVERMREREGATQPQESQTSKPLSLSERARLRGGMPQSPVEILAERTFGTQQKPTAEPIKIDVATDIVVGTERFMTPEQKAKVEKSLSARTALLKKRGFLGEVRQETETGRRTIAKQLSKTKEFRGWTEAQVYESMYASIWGPNTSISITKGGKVSLGVIQSLSPAEYMAYRKNGVLPADIKQRTIADIDDALMENWKRSHLLRQSIAKTKADVAVSMAEKQKAEAKYNTELNAVRNELIQMLASYQMFDVADEVLGAEKPKSTRYIPKEVRAASVEESDWRPARAIDPQNTPDAYARSVDIANGYKMLGVLSEKLGSTDLVDAMTIMGDHRLHDLKKEMSLRGVQHVLEEFNKYNFGDHRKWIANKEKAIAEYKKEKAQLDLDIKYAESSEKRRDTTEARARSNQLSSLIKETESSVDPIIQQWKKQAEVESLIHDILKTEPSERAAKIEKLKELGISSSTKTNGTLVSKDEANALRERTKQTFTSVRLSDPNAPEEVNTLYGFNPEDEVHSLGNYYAVKKNGRYLLFQKPNLRIPNLEKHKSIVEFKTVKDASARIDELRKGFYHLNTTKDGKYWTVRFREANYDKSFGPFEDEAGKEIQKQRAIEYAEKLKDETLPVLDKDKKIVEPVTETNEFADFDLIEERLKKVGVLPPEKLKKTVAEKTEIADESKRIAGGDGENYKDAMHEAYKVLQQSMKQDKTITPIQRFAVLMQSVARNYKKNGSNPVIKERLKQLEKMFKETEQLTDANMKRAYKRMLDYGFVSMNWNGDDTRSVLDATGHYVTKVEPPKKAIGMDFSKLKMPTSWKMKDERVVLTSTDGIRVSNNEMLKALKDLRTRFEFGDELSDEDLIELAKDSKATPMVEKIKVGWQTEDKLTNPFLTGEARMIRRWLSFEERKGNQYEETQSRIIYVEGKPKYILAKGDKSEKLLVIPFKEATYDAKKNTYYWSRDRSLNESTKATEYASIDSFLDDASVPFKAVRQLTIGDDQPRYTAHKPNGWHIDGKFFKTQEEAKRLAVIDAEENHAYEAVYKTAKRLDKDAYTTVLQMIQSDTGITYKNAIAEAIGAKNTRTRWIDNPEYTPDKPSSATFNPRKIKVTEDVIGATVPSEFKKLAIYRAGNLLLVTSDNRRDVLTRLSPAAPVSSKGGRTKAIEQIAREAVGERINGKKVLGDLYRIRKDENGNLAGIEWVTHYDNPRQVSEMLTKMDDKSFVDLDSSVEFHKRLTKEMKGVLATVHKEEKKKIFKVLTENPKKIKELQSQIDAIENARDKELEDSGVILKKGLNRSAKRHLIQRNIDRLTNTTNEMSFNIEEQIHYLASKGVALKRNVAERLVGEGKYYETVEDLRVGVQEAWDDAEKRFVTRDYAELDPHLEQEQIEKSLQTIEENWANLQREGRTLSLMEQIRDGDYGAEHEELNKKLEFAKLQLQAAKGSNKKPKAGLQGLKINAKDGAGRWIGTKEQAADARQKQRVESTMPLKADDVDIGELAKAQEGTHGATQRESYESYPKYLPEEGEEFVSTRDYMDRFQRLISDIAEAHKKFGDQSSLDKLSLRKLLETDADLIPLKEADGPIARSESLEAMKANIRNIEEYFDRTNMTPEAKQFKYSVDMWAEAQRQHMIALSENRIKAAVMAGLDGRKDHVIEANKMNKVLRATHEPAIKARMQRIDETFAKIPEELKPQFMHYIERVKNELEVLQASELERVDAEISSIMEVAGDYALREGEGRVGQQLAKWKEFGMKGDPLKRYRPDDERRQQYPFLFSEFYPTPEQEASATKYTKWESRATNDDVVSDTTSTGTRKGMNVGGFTTTNPIVAEVIRNESTRNKFIRMRGLREIDIFGAALAKKAYVEAQIAKRGNGSPIPLDAEGHALLQNYFPEIARQVQFVEDRVRPEKVEKHPTIEGEMVNRAFNHFIEGLSLKQEVIEHAIAVVSDKTRLAELTSPENLNAEGKIDLTKLKVEELDMAFHLLGKVEVPSEKRTVSLSELIESPMYVDQMLMAYSDNKKGNLQSIFGNDYQKAATFLASNGSDKRKMINDIITQINLESEKQKAEARKTYEENITTEWKVKELEGIAKEKLEATKTLLLQLAQTDTAVKAFKGRVEQFWDSRPQARTNVLEIEDNLKLLSPNMDYGKAIIGADGKTVDVPVANPNDALFRTANGMFHAFKQGNSYKLFFAGYKSADGLVNLAPSHIMTAPDVQRLQVAIRMFHDDVKRIETMASASKNPVDIKPSEIPSFSRSFLDVHGNKIAPDIMKAMEATLSKIGNYPDTTWIANPETGNKRQIVIYPNTETWNKLHDSGEYIFKNGTWYRDPAVIAARERLDRARLENEQLNVAPVAVAEVKPSEVLNNTASHTRHDQPDAKSKVADDIDNKTTMEVIEEGPIFAGIGDDPVMNDWNTIRNKEGWVILREQERTAKGWRTKFKTFFPSGIMAGLDDNEEDAVARMFK